MTGLTPQECRIMDLWDRGLNARQIAAELDLTLPRVVRLVQMNHEGTELKRHIVAMERGSAALAVAIERARR